MNRTRSAIAVIPAYNEADTITGVVVAARRHHEEVVVVDDGSRDDTADRARSAGARVLSHDRRRGKGSAVRTGLDAAREHAPEWFVLIDGDGQHDPDDTPRLFRAADSRGLDFVIGHRLMDRAAHAAIRYYTNVVACNMLSRWTGHEVLDSQSGFRLIRARLLEGIVLDSTGFEIETEMLLRLCRRGARVGHVEVRGIVPGRKSRLRPVRDVTRICLSAVKYQYLMD